MPQGTFKRGIPKAVPRCHELRGLHAGARQQQFIGHLTEHQARREGRQWDNRWPPKHFPQRLRKLLISDRVWCHGICRSLQAVSRERVLDGAYGIVQSDPTHVLPSIAEATS